MGCCADATVKEMPSHRSQCGGFAVSQNSNAQNSHAHTRLRLLPFILLTINDRRDVPHLQKNRTQYVVLKYLRKSSHPYLG
jgi:hypothetical protein